MGSSSAERVCRRPTQDIRLALARARRGQAKWQNRLFNRPKCAFLGGFIAVLESELYHRARRGDAQANPDTADVVIVPRSSERPSRLALLWAVLLGAAATGKPEEGRG
jgi:hypothetical protein